MRFSNNKDRIHIKSPGLEAGRTVTKHMDKSTVIRRLLSNAVQGWLIDHVLLQYKQEKITIGRAAIMVGIPLREMIAIASTKGIPFQYSIDDLGEDNLAAEKL